MALTWEEELTEDLPGSVAVYELMPPEVNEEKVRKEARRFGLEGRGRDFRGHGRWVEYQEGARQVAVHAESEAVHFRDLSRYGIHKDGDFDVSDEEAQGIARQFAASSELIPPEDEFVLEKVSHLREAGGNIEGEDRRESVIDAGVILRRVVDQVRVAGPGGFAMVNVDAEREVVGSRKVWRQRQRKADAVTPRKRDDAIRTMERIARKANGDVKVIRAALSYLEFGQQDRQAHLEPAFVFVYLIEKDDVVLKAAEAVPAGERGFGRLKGERRFPQGPARPRTEE